MIYAINNESVSESKFFSELRPAVKAALQPEYDALSDENKACFTLDEAVDTEIEHVIVTVALELSEDPQIDYDYSGTIFSFIDDLADL